jgi:hypothetical protein
MKPRRPGGFRQLGRVSGSAIGKIAVKVYVCRGCGVQHKGVRVDDKMRAPLQCLGCGRMDFDKFDSTGEAGRWAELLLKLNAGLISDLHKQVRFDLMAARADGVGVKVGQYVADFVYQRDGERVIEDHKGGITDLAAWKIRHMAAQGLPVKIHTAKGGLHE